MLERSPSATTPRALEGSGQGRTSAVRTAARADGEPSAATRTWNSRGTAMANHGGHSARKSVLLLESGERGAVQAEALVCHQAHRDGGGDVAMPPLVIEGLDKVAFGEARRELRGDAAANVHAAAR